MPVKGELVKNEPAMKGESLGFAIRKATRDDMPACARVLAPAFADKVEAIVGDMAISLRIIPTVMELMGHASITTTMKYAHPGPAHKRAAVNRLLFATYKYKSKPKSEPEV